MKKIKFIKDTEKFKKGEEAEATKKSADSYVKNGYAEYIDAPEVAEVTSGKFNIYHNGIYNTIPNAEIDLPNFLELLKQPKPLVDKIRKFVSENYGKMDKKEFDKQKDKIKKDLSYVTFAGIFSSRKAENFIKSSGYACFDIDDVQNLEEVKEKILKNKYTHCCFISPSGRGYKFVVKIPEVKSDEEYKQYWISISNHFNLPKSDDSTKDISRACYMSYDPEPYYNPDSKVYTDKVEDINDYSTPSENTENNTEKDTSRSARDYRECCSLIALGKTKEQVFKEMMSFAKWSESEDSYKIYTYNKAKAFIDSKNKKKITRIFTISGQVETFHDENPFFYDKSKMFWIWNKEKFKYELADETDVLNGISGIGVDTISSKTRGEVVHALKQYGRKNIPENAEPSCIQFQNKIYNFSTGKISEASPKFFITNPIPWEIGESEETPTMDKLFNEWVGKEYVETLYQLIAYSCSSEQFMQRMFALVGGGSNGKGTFLKMLEKFLGQENCTTSELKELSENQFETASIYRKLLCIMGEVSHDDLKNTNQLKKLSGEDMIRFCFKSKTPFSEHSATTMISATNSLPRTPDRTVGFYRRWLIIDFPHQFPVKQGVIESIPDVEYNNLAKKILRILQGLYKKQEFKNEGDFEEREKRYEERSNPVVRFIEQKCEEVVNGHIELRNFLNAFNEYAKENHTRLLNAKKIGKIIRDEGFEIAPRRISQGMEEPVSKKVILNLRLLS